MSQCPKCAQEIPADAPGGLCPSCAIRGALGGSDPGLPATSAHASASDEFTAPTAEELTRLLPQFRVEAELGRGGMGVVYRGIQLNLERPVAIKLLAPHLAADPAFAERFTREARNLARLNHTNIVAVYDFGRAGSFFYLVMELVDGANLRHVMRQGGIEPRQALEIVPQICDALQYAHDEGIVHRDIKPENILLDKRGRVKIADFGLAKLLGAAPGDVSLTATQQVMGTFRYMAPEQVGGTKTLDHRADIYSLGVVFYELLTGELPIGRFAPPSKKVHIDVRLDEVVLRALEQEPEQRYQHASELKTEVESVKQNPAPTGKSRAETASTPGSIAGRKAEAGVGQLLNDPRLSRCALWGAIWASCVFFLVVALVFWSLMVWSTARESANSSTAGGGQNTAPFFLAALMAIPLLLGGSAPFGTTILGVVAIGQIKRSKGRMYGLPLAVFDALVFPLLLLDLLLVTAVLLAGKNLPPEFDALAIPVTGLVAAWLDWRIIRAVWRNATGDQPPAKPAPAVPAAPAAPAAPAQAAAVEIPATDARPKLPAKFLARTAALAALVWLIFPLLWNLKLLGLAIACSAVSVMIVLTARRARAFLPATAQRWQAIGAVYRTTSGLIFALFGTYSLFVFGCLGWESLTWNPRAQSGRQFEQEYQGVEHRLLRPLPGYDKDVPRAELIPAGGMKMFGVAFLTSSPPYASLFGQSQALVLLFLGLWTIFSAYSCMLVKSRVRDVRLASFWPALQLTVLTLLPLVPYAFAAILFWPGSIQTNHFAQSATVTVDADIKTVMERIDAWAEARHFESGDPSSWRVNQVPTGGELATVELRHFWQPSVFDRWHMTLDGLQRVAPDLALQIIGDAAGRKTIAAIDLRCAAGGVYYSILCKAIQGARRPVPESPPARAHDAPVRPNIANPNVPVKAKAPAAAEPDPFGPLPAVAPAGAEPDPFGPLPPVAPVKDKGKPKTKPTTEVPVTGAIQGSRGK